MLRERSDDERERGSWSERCAQEELRDGGGEAGERNVFNCLRGRRVVREEGMERMLVGSRWTVEVDLGGK